MRTRFIVPVLVGACALFLLMQTGCKKKKTTTTDPWGTGTAIADPTAMPTTKSTSTPAASAADDDTADPAAVASADPAKHAAFLSQPGPVFTTVDGKYRLRAPGWKTEKSKDERNVLRVVKADLALNLYEEKKIDVTATNVDDFMTHETALKKKYNQMPRGTVTSLTVGGRAARQGEFDIVIDDNKWREILTIIDMPKEYLEVSVVVKPSKVDKKSMQVIVDTVELANP